MHFLHRTDELARRLGCKVKELAEPMGVSWRTIINGRTDPTTVSPKTWAALERAEASVGIQYGGSETGEAASPLAAMPASLLSDPLMSDAILVHDTLRELEFLILAIKDEDGVTERKLIRSITRKLPRALPAQGRTVALIEKLILYRKNDP